MNKSIFIFVLTGMVSGCAVGPDYQAPQSPHLSAFHAEPRQRPIDAVHHEAFWQGFQDPVLQRLIHEALQNNQDLHAMLARYRGAEALLRGTRSDRRPSVTANAGASRQELAEVERPASGSDQIDLYQAGASFHWEVDLFGRLARATEARQAQLEASGADFEALQVALVGQLAINYFELRGLQQQLRVAEQNVALQQSSLEIITARLVAGRGTEFDRLRARAQLSATRAAVPRLQAEISGNMHRIAVLTGDEPGALVEELAPATGELIRAVPDIPVGTPGEVLRRRPDIRSAERRLAAATARIGVATADLFPRFTLDGLIGTVSGDRDDMFRSGTGSRLIALGIDWSFLDVARVRARIDAADAETDAALAEYRQTVLLALEEVETWLVRYRQSHAHVALLGEAENAAREAVGQAQDRYRHGYIGFFELLAAEQELSHARDALVRSQTARALAMVNVYRALAGAPESRGAAVVSVSVAGKATR